MDKIYHIGQTQYKVNPNGIYALYSNDGIKWRESASVYNSWLTESDNEREGIEL